MVKKKEGLSTDNLHQFRQQQRQKQFEQVVGGASKVSTEVDGEEMKWDYTEGKAE